MPNAEKWEYFSEKHKVCKRFCDILKHYAKHIKIKRRVLITTSFITKKIKKLCNKCTEKAGTSAGVKKHNTRRRFSKTFMCIGICLVLSFQMASCATHPKDNRPTEGAPYHAPVFNAAEWKGIDVYTEGMASIDFSSAAEGYIGAVYTGDTKAKIQIRVGDFIFNYDINGEGTPEFFPLQMGDGEYTVRILIHLTGTKYTAILQTKREIVLQSEFAPFLVANQFVNYDENSDCVALFYEITKDCKTDIEVVTAVYDYIRSNIEYDRERALEVQSSSGYVPDLDQVLCDKKGICFDYASLTAAMLRTGGIPTRVIFGYVGGKDLYHAWNLIYLEGYGWITITMYIDAHTWELIDLTFAAGMSDEELAQFIGDGSHYSQVYMY